MKQSVSLENIDLLSVDTYWCHNEKWEVFLIQMDSPSMLVYIQGKSLVLFQNNYSMLEVEKELIPELSLTQYRICQWS